MAYTIRAIDFRANKFWAAAAVAGMLAIGASAGVLKSGFENPVVSTAPSVMTSASSAAASSGSLLGLPAGWPLTTPLPVPSVVATSQSSTAVSRTLAPRTLLPLDLRSMWLWNWGGTWIGSEWGNPFSTIPWKFDRIKQVAGADTVFTLDAAGAPEIQGGGATAARTDGLWETDVTLPQLREGLVVAPLWIYDPTSRDEIDFEYAGRRGLDVTMHVYVNGVHKSATARLFAGTDMSGQRKRFGIKVDQVTGYVEMYVDGALVYRWNRAALGFFVSRPMKPWIQMMAVNPNNAGFVQWAGKWTPLAAGQTLTMRVHGYGFSTLAGDIVR